MEDLLEGKKYDLTLTNMEIRLMFEQIFKEWFSEYTSAYNESVKAIRQKSRHADDFNHQYGGFLFILCYNCFFRFLNDFLYSTVIMSAV